MGKTNLKEVNVTVEDNLSALLYEGPSFGEMEDAADNYIPKSSNSVNHPDHYNHSGIETIDVIAAWTHDLEGEEAFDIGNAIKYISRWKWKNGVEDLKKAVWYLNRVIEINEE